MDDHLHRMEKQTDSFFSRDDMTEQDSIDMMEWNEPIYADTSENQEIISGMIVARLPDLGECKTISTGKPSSGRSFSDWAAQATESLRNAWQRIDLSAVGRLIGSSIYHKHPTDRIDQNSPVDSSIIPEFNRRKSLYSSLIAMGIVLFFCGLFFLVKGPKKSDPAVENASGQTLTVKTESIPTSPVPKPASVEKKVAANAANSESNNRVAEKKSSEKPALKPAPKTAPGKVDAVVAKQKKSTPTSPKVVPNNVAASKQNVPKQLVIADKIDPDSPWDRSTVDAYSPWTMNPTKRLDAVQQTPVSPLGNGGTDSLPSTPIPTVGLAVSGNRPSMNIPVTKNPVPYSVQTPVYSNQIPAQSVPQGGFATTSRYPAASPMTHVYPGSSVPSPYQGQVHAPRQPIYPSQTRTPQSHAYHPGMTSSSVPAPSTNAGYASTPTPGRIPIPESPQSYHAQGASQHPGATYVASVPNSNSAMAAPILQNVPVQPAPTYQQPPAPAQAMYQTSPPVNQTPVYQGYQEKTYQQATYHVPVPAPAASAPAGHPSYYPPYYPPQSAPMGQPVYPSGTAGPSGGESRLY